MIDYLKGKITYKDDKALAVENQGLGYKVFCAPNTLKKAIISQEAQIFTHLHLKENAVELYGFLSRQELELFETLNNISGIGPKTAMMLASLGSLEKLKEMMEKGQLPGEIKGIGQKRMQKILLELTGKIKELPNLSRSFDGDEALGALVSLGFPQAKAKEALASVPMEIQDIDQRVKEAIKILGRS